MDYIVDVRTKDANALVRRFKRLKSTISVERGGAYREDLSYTQVLLTSTKTEAEIDHWLWKYSGPIEYVGVITINETQGA